MRAESSDPESILRAVDEAFQPSRLPSVGSLDAPSVRPAATIELEPPGGAMASPPNDEPAPSDGSPHLEGVETAASHETGVSAAPGQAGAAADIPMAAERPAPLSSPSAKDRKEALESLLSAPAGIDSRAVSRLLVEDPDPANRTLAARALAAAPEGIERPILEQALEDPSDQVRSAAVELARAAGPRAADLLISAVTERRYPLAQAAALAALPELLGPPQALGDRKLEDLLDAVARLDPPPLPPERPGLGALARAVGVRRLESGLRASGSLRSGAAWLLFLEGGRGSLTLVAELADDESEAVRDLARTAARLVAPRPSPGEAGVLVPPHGPARDGLDPANLAIRGLASALYDPDRSVRDAAEAGLRGVPRATLAAWAERAFRQGADEEAALAAELTGRLGLDAAVAAGLERAAQTPPAGRGPYIRALTSLRLTPQSLVDHLASLDPANRQTAVRLVWQVAGQSVVPALTRLLSDSAGPVRMAVLEVLGESREPQVIELAQGLLQSDSSAAVRATAVHVLARAAEPARLAALDRALTDPDPDVRATAVQALPHGASTSVPRFLLAALGDEDGRVWRAALPHLAGLPEPETPMLWSALRESEPAKREELIQAIEHEDHRRLEALAVANVGSADHTDRTLAVEMAARAGTPACTGAVVKALEDPDPRVRRTAAVAMSTLRTPTAVEALGGRLSDPQVEIRMAAIRALSVIDDDGVPDVMISALKDPEVRVRQLATEALARWRSPAVARRLASVLGVPELRRPVAEVLERMGDLAREPLIEVVMGTDPEAAAEAGSVLERIIGPQPFIKELSATDTEARIRSVEVLGAMGGPGAVDALIGVLSDPDSRVRSRAAALLGGLGEARAAKALRRMVLSDPVPDVATAAEAALRLLETIPSRPVGAPPGDRVKGSPT